MAIKRYFTFLEPHYQIVVLSRTLVGAGSYLSAEMLLVYSTASAKWDEFTKDYYYLLFEAIQMYANCLN